MKKIFFMWSVLSFLCNKTSAQFEINNIDSLKQQLLYAKEDTNKVLLLLKLSNRFTWSYADTSIMYVQQALDLSQELNYERGIISAEGQMGLALITAGNYPLALEYSFKNLERAVKKQQTSRLVYANLNVAMCYREQGDYRNSLIFIRNSLTLARKVQLNDASTLWGVSSSVYERNNQLDSAMLYAKKAYEIQKNWSGLLYVLGSVFTKMNNYDSAMYYYRAGLLAAERNHTEIDAIDIYNGIAIVQMAKNNLDSAAWYATKALNEKVGRTYPLGLLRSTTILVDLYQSQHKTDSILKYLSASASIKDSLFNREKTIAIQNLALKEREKQKEIEASKLESRNRIWMNALLGSFFTLLVIAFLLYRNGRIKQNANQSIQNALDQLKATQSQLIQSEKMASLGELTAGIAHEIQNPLNFVNNFSEVNEELLVEMKGELERGNLDDAKTIANDAIENQQKILHHGKRADAIVKGMLQHSRAGSGQKELTDINALCDEYLRLSYHGLRAKDKFLPDGQAGFNAKFETNLDPTLPKVNVVPQDIGRVILNLINNAFYAVTLRHSTGDDTYQPTVWVSTQKLNDKILISVKDNGSGIPQKNLDKIFQPFFTTKPTGQGTGLGLSLSYDIVKAHGGELRAETKEGEGSEFFMMLSIV